MKFVRVPGRPLGFLPLYLVLCTLYSLSAAAPRVDSEAGLWRDSFTDLAGLTLNQQGEQVAPMGFSIASTIQMWSQPFSSTGLSESFSSGSGRYSAGTFIQDAGTTAEYLTVWYRQSEPGTIAQECLGGTKGDFCDLEMMDFMKQNGYLSTGDFVWNTYTEQGLIGGAKAAGWDTDRWLNCRPPLVLGGSNTISIASFYMQPLLFGIAADLDTDVGYAITYLTSAWIGAQHQDHHEQYLRFQAYETSTKAAYLCTTLYEDGYLSVNVESEAAKMTPVTLHMPAVPDIPDAEWDFQVVSLVQAEGPITDRHVHCTFLGPVWLTADRAVFTSPVFDTLSDSTRWVDISWDADQTGKWLMAGNTATLYYTDSPKSVIPTGSPLTPIALGYRIGGAPAGLAPTNVVEHGGEKITGLIGKGMVDASSAAITDAAGNPVQGRYFQWSATLYTRSTAHELDRDLKPSNVMPYPDFVYFGAFRPKLRRVSVRYYVCAAQAVSTRIAPSSLKAWKAVRHETSPARLAADGSQGSVVVDVLSQHGAVLKANVKSGDSLASISPYDHTALVLRATLDSDPGCTFRPALTAWEVTWEPQAGVVDLGCNGIRPDLGEKCRIVVGVPRPGRVKVDVHDAAGQAVRVLLDEDSPAEARLLLWDGRNEQEQVVAAGVYFVTARVPGGKQVERLAVIR